jgi:hypothetical protein
MNYIVFGDSHSRCFEKIFKTHVFIASSAKGLGNPDSISQTNNKIIEICKTKYKGYIFLFGKVDNDWILNHIYNTRPDTNLYEYIENIVINYIHFINSLNITNVYICELAISHMSDLTMLKLLNKPFRSKHIHNILNIKYSPIKYKKIIPRSLRNTYLLFFNECLKKYSKLNNFNILEINKYFMKDNTYCIPSIYLNKDLNDHHLNNNIHKLYLKTFTASSEYEAYTQSLSSD